MRAPPDAETQTNGTSILEGDAHAAHEALADDRAHRPAHELELERRRAPSGTLRRCPASRPARRSRRSRRAPLASRSGYFFWSLNLRLSTGTTSEPISKRPSGSSSCSMRSRALDSRVMAALRADHQVLLEVGAIEHRLARRALDPQALGHRAVLRTPGELLMRGGSSFCSQLIVIRPIGRASCRSCRASSLHRVQRARGCRRATRPRARLRRRRRPRFDLLDDAAADDDRVGVRGDRLRARRVARCRNRRRPAGDTWRRISAELARDIGGVEVCLRRSRP